jgi:hypothetical protein
VSELHTKTGSAKEFASADVLKYNPRVSTTRKTYRRKHDAESDKTCDQRAAFGKTENGWLRAEKAVVTRKTRAESTKIQIKIDVWPQSGQTSVCGRCAKRALAQKPARQEIVFLNLAAHSWKFQSESAKYQQSIKQPNCQIIPGFCSFSENFRNLVRRISAFSEILTNLL